MSSSTWSNNKKPNHYSSDKQRVDRLFSASIPPRHQRDTREYSKPRQRWKQKETKQNTTRGDDEGRKREEKDVLETEKPRATENSIEQTVVNSLESQLSELQHSGQVSVPVETPDLVEFEGVLYFRLRVHGLFVPVFGQSH